MTDGRLVERQIYLNECKKCYIQRDYSAGLQVRFSTDFPQELENKVDDHVWSLFIEELNAKYRYADGVSFSSIFESTLSFLTCNISRLCYPTVWNRVLKDVDNFIADRNRTVFIPRNLYVRDPVAKGLRVIEVSILDEKLPATQQPDAATSTTPMLTPR